MRQRCMLVVWLAVAGLGAPVGFAEEAPAPKAAAGLSSATLTQLVQDYVKQIRDEEGDFSIEDEVTGNLRMLTLEQVGTQLTQEGDTTYLCAQMKDVDTGDSLDVDFGAAPIDGKPDIVDVRIHKVNGQVREAPAEEPVAQ